MCFIVMILQWNTNLWCYNSTIICGIGHTCTVFCYGNGCNELTLLCSDGGNTSCVFNIDCSYAEKSHNINVCPNGMWLLGSQWTINNQQSIYNCLNIIVCVFSIW